jgi:hypothetical protein
MRMNRPPPVPSVVLVVGVLLLALSLAWHPVGMNHGMGPLGACLAILAAGLAALRDSGAWDTTRITGASRAVPLRAGPLLPAARSRPPSRGGTVLRR